VNLTAQTVAPNLDKLAAVARVEEFVERQMLFKGGSFSLAIQLKGFEVAPEWRKAILQMTTEKDAAVEYDKVAQG
jgi:hypothetical protein